MTSPRLLSEIRRRSVHFLSQRVLEVEFYRVRQRLAISLPLTGYPTNLSEVRGLPDYPFSTWVLWALEERIFSLGWEAEGNGSFAARAAVEQDLIGLSRWQFPPELAPGLWSSHFVRILITAQHWSWPDRILRETLRATLIRLVECLAEAETPEEPSNHIQFANIPVITNIGWAIGAFEVGHASAETALRQVMAKLKVWLDQGLAGHCEGACYDGYVADFLMDFVLQASAIPDRKVLLGHPRLRQILEEIVGLGAPARPENLAQIGDVEPEKMLFHYSFAAKFLSVLEGSIPFVAPGRLLRMIRSDGIPYLPANGRLATGKRIAAGKPGDAHYALVWDFQPRRLQAKAVVAWSHSVMGHIHCDAGHLVVAVGKHWMITDPGYQQYLKTSEREFTIGPSAHNVPVVNGSHPTKKPTSRAFQLRGEETELDLTTTYPDDAGIQSVRRSIRIEGARIFVRDQITADVLNTLDYYWHAHPEAFLRVEGGDGVIGLENRELTLRCGKWPFVPGEITRLRGSRGSLSFCKKMSFPVGTQSADVEWELTVGNEAKRT